MKTNLLLIHDSMAGGGAERVLSTLLNNIDRNRFNITFLLIYKEGVFLESVPDDIEVIGLFDKLKTPLQRLATHFYGVRNFIRERRARRLLAGRKFDVTVSFMEGPVAKLHSQLLDLAPRNLSWVHINLNLGRWYDFWFKKEEEREFYKHVDKIAFVSEEARDAFKSLFTTDAELEVIYNPVDPDAIRRRAGDEYKSESEPFTIINVGRLVDQKRHDRLIKAAKILKDHGCRFKIEILGIGPLENELKALSAELGTEDCVNFAGFINNPFPWMKKADVFCLTSKTEGYPMVITETLSLHTPVVSTKATGVTEMLAHGGGVFTTDSPEDIADKLEHLIKNPAELAKLKAETVESAKQFRLDLVMDKIAEFITH